MAAWRSRSVAAVPSGVLAATTAWFVLAREAWSSLLARARSRDTLARREYMSTMSLTLLSWGLPR